MNLFTNIWKNPKTTAAGLLISIGTVAGVLGQQGITLGRAGSGTVVTLIGGLATALLGLLARDPEKGSGEGISTQKLGAWALIALLLPLPFVGGCSGTKVAQEIVNWMPSLESAVATADSTASLLDPSDASAYASITSGFDTAANVLVSEANAYLANPSTSVLTQLQTAVVTFQQQVNSALLSAAKISNSSSQQRAMSSINAVATAVTAILALVQTVSSRQDVERMASQLTVKHAAVEKLMNHEAAAAMVAQRAHLPIEVARIEVRKTETQLVAVGL